MRVTVDHCGHVLFLELCVNHGGVHIHDVACLVAVLGLALCSQHLTKSFSLRQSFAEDVGLPSFGPKHRPHLLVRGIVCAVGITVGQ